MCKNKGIIIFVLVIVSVFVFNVISNCKEVYNEILNIDWHSEINNVPKEVLEELNIKDINNVTDEELELVVEKYVEENLGIALVAIFGFSIIETILTVFIRFFFIWVIIIAIIVSNKKIRKSKLSSDDLGKYKGYWRDLLNEYSVSVLAFIDDFKLNYPSVLIAMLLQLEHKKVISINEEFITIDNICELDSTETFILKNIENGKLKNFSIPSYEQIVEKQAVLNNLLINRKPSKSIIFKDILISIVIYVLALILFNLAFDFLPDSLSGVSILLIFVLLAMLVLFLALFPIYKIYSLIILYAKLQKETYFRSKKGEEVNKKIEGLKNYLKDFSILSERGKEELVLWDEYLVYSVLFEHNDEIINKYKNLII